MAKDIIKNPSLTVFKASAGSGKTFTLAIEYIKLLILSPYSYSSILAVTFTNKATAEMKERILSQLYGLWKQLPDKQTLNYMNKITAELHLSRQQVSRQAGIALNALLHNYHYFRIQTIDTFFQGVLRNLARELDMPANMRVDLNDYDVEEQAVDHLIEQLRPGSLELRWIMEYIENRIDDDKSWNVIGLIKKFGRNIFRDFFKERGAEVTAKLGDENFFNSYVGRLRKMRHDAEEKLQQLAETFFDILSAHGLTEDDFLYKKAGVCGYFIKMRQGIYDGEELLKSRVTDAMADSGKWVSQKRASYGDGIMSVVTDELMPLLQDTERLRPELERTYKSASITLRHIDQLRLLGSIEETVRMLNSDAGRFQLSDTQFLLHKLIGESDSPFIFEKIGTQLEHIMIDEFQDTSRTQWGNFKILLDETMSRNNPGRREAGDIDSDYEVTGNLIVGDVKQSIYRWREGDWRLLNNILDEFPGRRSEISIRHLDVNYRSASRIIKFNNAFFTHAIEAECARIATANPDGAEELRQAYSDVTQQLPENKAASADEGYVEIELLPAADYDTKVMERLKQHVTELMSRGVKPEDMAIIVRSNKTIQQIADYFMGEMPELPIVSDEAFCLDASLSVNTIIDAMSLLIHPDDMLATARLVKIWQKHILGNTGSDSTLFISHTDNSADNSASYDEQRELKIKSLRALLPTDYSLHTEELLALPISDLAEKIYSIFSLSSLKGQSAYVCAFFDELSSWAQEQMADISSFIEEWNTSIHSKTIQSDEVKGLRLITIHKSKGLEFNTVLMPYCDWRLEQMSTIWCEPTEKPYSELPVIPVDFSRKAMASTIYEQDYNKEHLQNMVDNLNLLYVAFTRAGSNLIVMGRRDTPLTREYLIEETLPKLSELEDSDFTGEPSDKNAELCFSYGELPDNKEEAKDSDDNKDSKDTTANVFLQKPSTLAINIRNYKSNADFRQSNESEQFISGDDDRQGYISMGNVLHSLFSTIRTSDDISRVLDDYERNGIIYGKDFSRESLVRLLTKRLANPQVAEWFLPKWKLFNECNIIWTDDDGKVLTRRPDRVMSDGHRTVVVDFKFGSPRTEYENQVKLYMSLLSRMGYPDVEGYLWFVYTGEVKQVFM